uniref:Double-stranded RNA-binding protein 4 n=1 Tax=Noccaea caerulescens TaxID=107243 RepID=A0A1J3K6W8_NOCCA
MDHVYKSQLQSYALKQNMDLPVYDVERQGAAHAPRFRCKVTVCGQTFQSQDFSPTLKAAEHAAAKVALASLTPLNPEGIDVAYKNLLQEIAQKENYLLPVYASATSGPSHKPTFISTVEFAGKSFTGEEAKTKKLAEMSAAKVAFLSITNRNSNQTSSLCLPCERQEAASSNVKSSQQEIPSHPCKKMATVTPDVPSKWIEVYEDDVPDAVNPPDVVVASPVPQNPTNDTTFDVPATRDMEMNNISCASLPVPPSVTNEGKETSCGEEIEKKLIMGTGHLSIPSGQHVVCRPWNPAVTLPQDAEMLFRDDRFIAYRVVKP